MMLSKIEELSQIDQKTVEDLSYQPSEEWHSGMWVKLFDPPTSCYFDEAILLCQESDNSWIAWLPEHGQIVLHQAHKTLDMRKKELLLPTT